MLLSTEPVAATGRFRFESESQKAHRQMMFQFAMPVFLFKFMSISRERAETRMFSTGGFMIPEIAFVDFG